MNQTLMPILGSSPFPVSSQLSFLGFGKGFLIDHSSCLQNSNFESLTRSFNYFPFNLLVLVLLFVLAWKVLQLSGKFKSLDRICNELNKRSIDGGNSFNSVSSDDNFSSCLMENSKGRDQITLNRRDDFSFFRRKIDHCNCKFYVVCEHGLPSGEGNHEEMDLGKGCSENLNNGADEDEKETDLSLAKKAIMIEREYREAVYLELEKERKAAASAANEAMAMILRLQNEKNSVQMQARQYRRVAEQRHIYDQETIQSLREIVSKQELEMRLLEDQLKVNKQKFVGKSFSAVMVGEEKENETRVWTNIEEQKLGDLEEEFEGIGGTNCSSNGFTSENCTGGFTDGLNGSLGIDSPLLCIGETIRKKESRTTIERSPKSTVEKPAIGRNLSIRLWTIGFLFLFSLFLLLLFIA